MTLVGKVEGWGGGVAYEYARRHGDPIHYPGAQSRLEIVAATSNRGERGKEGWTAVSSGASSTARTRRLCAAQLRQFALPVRRSCLAQSSIESHFLKVKDVFIIGKLPQDCEKSGLYVFCLHPCSENVNSATVLRVSVCVRM